MKAIIIGAGFSGAACARRLAEQGCDVLLLERSAHIGGNAYDEKKNGAYVHRYGPHIFHTSDEGVWRLACRFVRFNRFRLHVKANYKGRIYSLPFNLNTFREMWGTATPEEARRHRYYEICGKPAEAVVKHYFEKRRSVSDECSEIKTEL